MELVDHPLMYTCCPYLGELRSLLIDFAVGGSTKQNNIRKITPIAAECEDEDTGVNEKQLQLQLEENFFHNHPASLKRTVEFVADRVASIHIKKFRSQELPRFISIGIGAVGEMLSGTGSGSPDNRLKTRLEQQVLEVARNLMQTARNDIVSSFTAYCQQKTEAILPMLLPDDTVPQVLAVSMQISARLALEKVTHWSQAHLTTNMLNKEMTSELDKLVRSMASGLDSPVRPVKGEKTVQVVHGNPAIVVQTKDVCAVSETINMLKDFVRDLVLEKDGVSYQRMLKLLRQTKDTFFGTANIFPLAYKTVALLWLDLAVSCAIFKPPYITEESLGDLTALWQGPLKQHTSFCQVICAKYVHLLMAKSKVLQESWNQYAFLLRHLLNQELLTWADVKEAGLKLLQHNLPKDCLELFAACICDSCKVFSEDKTMGTIDCLELLNSLDQKCANCSSVTIQAVKDCISIINEQQLPQDTKCSTEKMSEIADIEATTGNTLHETLHPQDEKHQPIIKVDEQEQNKNSIKVECDCVHTEKYCQKCTLCFNKENQTDISSCDEKILPKVDSMQVKIAGI
ncbi:codanin-1-like isoform X1 [Lingula anatina]|uniref:Codanin-1-like isoform X1 n=1 Tax=Lingula anatina TaxID=7574 RepID=A0A1S3IP45_LINAN|nr:codanin-1-like isoform X1 [Lingula anatina]|eukprot:XP_013399853.1 codanin-1-like isoform X1 [Lingula anatina]